MKARALDLEDYKLLTSRLMCFFLLKLLLLLRRCRVNVSIVTFWWQRCKRRLESRRKAWCFWMIAVTDVTMMDFLVGYIFTVIG